MVIEQDGSFALSAFRSQWCRYLDNASRELCGNVTNGEAIKSGKWLCRNSCWRDSGKIAIQKGSPVDTECEGGIRIYTVPIKAGGEFIGVISLGYGDPPKNPGKLKEIAARYDVDCSKLTECAKSYESRPPFIIDTAKSWMHSSGRMIGSIVERKRAEIALQKAYSEIEKRVEARTAALTRSYNLLKDETRERIKAEKEASKRYDALESVYAMATAFSVSLEATIDQVILSISTILKTPIVALGRIEKNEFTQVAQVLGNELKYTSSVPLDQHPCGIAYKEKRSFQITGRLYHLYPNFMKDFPATRAYMGIPILNSRGFILGTICVLDKRDRVFSEDEIHLVEIFARYIGHEIDRKNMERQLLQSQEMKMLGQLTSGVAHEVRNPLNGILAITDALSKDLGENPEYRTFIEHIRKQVIRLSDLMRDLLDLGRPIESANLMATSIMWLTSAAVNMWQHSSCHRQHIVRIQASKDVESVTVYADRAKMEQVIINLLENACAHSKTEREVIIELFGHDGTVIIKVIDMGAGIKPEYFEHLFEPFFTTRKGGTGLGLGIVKRIVESHGGAIDIRNNEPPPGVSVEIKLPIINNGQ